MSEAKHTPTPWRRGQQGNLRLYSPDGMGSYSGPVLEATARINPGERVANLEFAERACNCHDELLAALKDFVQSKTLYDLDRARSYARSVIAKSEGRS